MRSEYFVARELHKTHAQLWRDMGPGEIAFWFAYLNIEAEDREQATKAAERQAKRKGKR